MNRAFDNVAAKTGRRRIVRVSVGVRSASAAAIPGGSVARNSGVLGMPSTNSPQKTASAVTCSLVKLPSDRCRRRRQRRALSSKISASLRVACWHQNGARVRPPACTAPPGFPASQRDEFVECVRRTFIEVLWVCSIRFDALRPDLRCNRQHWPMRRAYAKSDASHKISPVEDYATFWIIREQVHKPPNSFERSVDC